MTPYQLRDFILKQIGYSSYREYLSSERWKKIRLRVLRKDNFVCRSCGCHATQVHHSRYDKRVLLGQSLRGLWSSCAACHAEGEFDGDRKTTTAECNERMGIPLPATQAKWRRKNGLKPTWTGR